MAVTFRESKPGWVNKLLKRYNGGAEIAVGFPVGSEAAAMTYPDGKKVIDVAIKNEFGIGVPERSFLRTGGPEFIEDSKPLIEAALQRVNAGAKFKDEADKIGMKAVAAIQQKIVDIDTPPNSAATIAAKGSSNPLIDTGLMRQSVTFEVR